MRCAPHAPEPPGTEPRRGGSGAPAQTACLQPPGPQASRPATADHRGPDRCAIRMGGAAPDPTFQEGTLAVDRQSPRKPLPPRPGPAPRARGRIDGDAIQLTTFLVFLGAQKGGLPLLTKINVVFICLFYFTIYLCPW